MKNSKMTLEGTSFKGLIIKATFARLQNMLGNPTKVGSSDDKVNYTWVFNDRDDNIITVYDYKQGIITDKEIPWHVGGNNNTKEDIEYFLLDDIGFDKTEVVSQ